MGRLYNEGGSAETLRTEIGSPVLTSKFRGGMWHTMVQAFGEVDLADDKPVSVPCPCGQAAAIPLGRRLLADSTATYPEV